MALAVRPRLVPKKLTELGRLRIGDLEPNANGRGTHPHKLDTFRLTSSNKPLLEYAAKHPAIGGTVAPWDGAPGDGKQWQLYTEATSLDVLIPTFDAVSVQYEQWSAGGCQRRCTGEFITHSPLKEALIGLACQCPPDDRERDEQARQGKACARILRINVLLPDLPGTGYWRLDSKGFYATAEMLGTLELLQMAGAEHTIIEGALRLEQRTVKRPGQGEGKGTLHFVVPVLWPRYTPRQLLASAAQRGTILMEAPVVPSLPARAAQAADDLFGDGAGDVFRSPLSEPQAGAAIPSTVLQESPEKPEQPKRSLDDPGASEGASPDDALQAVADLQRQLDAILTAQGTNLQAWRNQQAKRFKRSFADLEPVILERLLVELHDAPPRVRTPQELAGPPPPSAWRDTLRAHLSTLPAGDLHTACVDALADGAYSESEGLALAARVLATVETTREEEKLPF